MRRPLRRLLATACSAAALAAGWALTAPAALPVPAAAHAPAHAPAAPAQPAALTAAFADLARTRAARSAALNMPRAFTTVTARGDTLSSVAAHACGTARFWPVLWWANRHALHNPDVLPAHLTLTVPPCHAPTPAQAAAALAAIPPPPPPPPPAPAGPAAAGPVAQSAPAPPGPAPAAATGSVTPSSAYEACVISSESGGNAGAVNASSGAGGLYQFLPSTWASLGYSGSPQDADPATQQQAFDQLYAQSGSAPWSSDGCG